MKRGGSEKTNVCGLCEEQPAVLLCAECCKCYCSECNKLIHKMAKKKGHRAEPIPGGVRVEAMCPLHKNKPLNMFCVDEVELCCSACGLLGPHKGHTLVRVSDISEGSEVFSAAKALSPPSKVRVAHLFEKTD